MKLLNSLILIVLIKIITISSYECEPKRNYTATGGVCKVHGDCNFPDVCWKGVCGRIRMPGQACKVKTDCSLNYNWADCIDGECQLNIKAGEKCGSHIHSFKGNCVKGTECKDGTCQLNVDCNQYNCPLNTYCNLSTKKCQAFSNSTSPVGGCKTDNQCKPGFYCNTNNGKCIKNYSTKIGESCIDNSERSCNYYNGEICNLNTKKCEINTQYGKSCKDESTCNGGLCVCTDSNESVCVGPSGELNQSNCKDYESMLHRCIEKEGCSNLTPITCSKCFILSECIQYECNAIEKYYDYKTNYYKSLNCTQELKKSNY